MILPATTSPQYPNPPQPMSESIQLASDGGGHWVTIDGVHVLIKDGEIVKGPAHLVGKPAVVRPAKFYDADAEGTSKTGTGLFGQSTFDKATGSTQGTMFEVFKPAEPDRHGASRNAANPKHTGRLFNMSAINLDTSEGHWVTIEGNHVLIKDPIGGGRGFSKAAIERKLIAHHESLSGNDTARLQEEDATQHTGGGATTFRRDPKTKSGLPRDLEDQFTPAEISQLKQRGIVKITDSPTAHAGGEDAMSESGMGIDRYTTMLRRSLDTSHARQLEAAKATAHASNDPEMQFTAAIHDNLPLSGSERTNTGTISANKLKVGQEFQIHGQTFRVVENADGYRVLATPPGFPEDVPLDALDRVPIDRGSLRQTRTKSKKGDAVPFSRTVELSMSAPAPMPALTLGQGLPTKIKVKIGDEEKEIPVSYWQGDAIACGNYVHPVTGQKLAVDEKRLDAWVEKFNAMRAANRKIPTPTTHFGDDARDNVGEVIGMQRVGDRLKLMKMVKGERGAEIAAANSCSVKIDPDFVDEFGHHWGEAIVHSAFTPHPVVSGMGSFVPFAASRDRQAETPVFYLSADERNPDMDFKQLREALGAAADVPDDKLLDKVKELKTAAATNLSRAEEAERKVTTLSREPATPAAVDPEILRDRNDAKRERIEIAMSRGDLPKVVADKLLAALPADKPNAFMLSRSAGQEQTPVDFILGLFKDSQLGVAAGSTTAVQSGTVLSREVPGAQPDADAKIAEEGRKQGEALKNQLLAQQAR